MNGLFDDVAQINKFDDELPRRDIYSSESTSVCQIIFIKLNLQQVCQAMKTDFKAPGAFNSVAVVVPAIKMQPVIGSQSINFISVLPESYPKIIGNYYLKQS